MARQIPVAPDARADAVEAGSDAAHAITEDLAYRRLGIVNVVFVGPPGAGDRGWVLLDGGLPGTATAIRDTVGARFAAGRAPRGDPAHPWPFRPCRRAGGSGPRGDAPVYAHGLEKAYLDGSAAQESAYAVATRALELHGPPTYLTLDWDAAGASSPA